MTLLLFALSVFFAKAEVYLGLEPNSQNICDINLVHGLENQISIALCLESMDPVCLQEHFKNKMAMPGGRGADDDVSVKVTTSTAALKNLSNPAYFLKNRSQIVKKWLQPSNSKSQREDCRPSRYFPKQKELGRWQINPADLIAGTLEMVPLLGTMISSMKSVMESVSYVDLKTAAPETTCNWSDIHVSTFKEGADCLPYYNAESPAVRHMLRQTDSDKAKIIQNPNTCSYYNRLLAAVYVRNQIIERQLLREFPTIDEPSCEGKNKVQLNFQINHMGLDTPFTVKLNTSSQNPSYTISNNIRENSRSEMKISYENKGNGYLCEKIPEKTNFGVSDAIGKMIVASNLASATAAACCEQTNQSPSSCMKKNLRIAAPKETPAPPTVIQ